MPTDGPALNYIEEKWPIFKEEPRNVRLSLVADAPFESCSTYSVSHFHRGSFVLHTQCGPFPMLGMCYILCMCVCGRVRYDNCI
jgi:hypothetical protein